jgi:hypothetical protein
MISLPIPIEAEQLIVKLSDQEKKALSVIIQAFVARPKRTMPQVMDDMAEYAKQKGLNIDKLDDLLIEE